MTDITNPLDPSEKLSLANVAVNAAIRDIGLDARPDAQLIVGLLDGLRERAGESGYRIGLALAAGQSRGMAALAGGLTRQGLAAWCKRDRSVAMLLDSCEQLGFSTVLESELYRRALNGESDRGSMRALELVVKARDATYRDKAQVQMEVVHRAQEAVAGAFGGWEGADENNAARG